MQTNHVERLRFQLVAAEFLVRMGARIERQRKERGLSRADLARLLPGKVNENQIYRWERGKHQPNPDTLQALADALEVDVAELLAPEPAEQATPDLVKSLNGPLDERLDRIEADLARVLQAIGALAALEARRQEAPSSRRRRRGGNPPPAAS